MAFKFAKAAIAVLMLGSVAGCATSSGQVLSAKQDNWGEANRQTMAAQIIDPAPVYEDPNPATTGSQVAAAIERVRTDQVKKPERIKTSATATSGSGK
jgi:hypothetical protein